MRAAIRYANTFTSSRFGGNPTPVTVLPRWPADDTLLALARETGLGYAAFVVSAGGGDSLRWFHPMGDADMALALPAARAQAADAPDAIVAAIGRRPREAWRSDRWVLVYDAEEDVAAIAPDFPALARAEPGEVVVTAAASRGSAFDFVCRCFEPALGVDEDPVTGSAQCTLGPYWAERVGRTRLRSRQISARGGEITCVVGPGQVTISGGVFTYLEGVVEVGED